MIRLDGEGCFIARFGTFWVGVFSDEKSLGPRFSMTELRQFVSVQPFCFRRDVRSIHVYENPQDRSCHVNQPAAIRFEKQRDCRKFILVRDVGDFLRTVRLTRWKVKMNKGPAIRI